MVKPVLPAIVLLCFSLTVHSFNITFGTPQQCGSLQISWTGSSAAQLKFPLFLHILPFASTVIASPIGGWNSSMTLGSVSVPFTLRGGTQFLLAVMDRSGEVAGPVSEIQTAAISQDTSCLKTKVSPPRHFNVHTTPDLFACPSLAVSWDDKVKKQRPTVKAFSPGMLPVDLDPSEAAAPLNRSVFSTGNFTSKTQVVVLFDDKGSPAQTSELLTVGGTDGASCATPSSTTSSNVPSTSSTGTVQTIAANSGPVSNKAGVIVGAVASGIVGIAMVLFAVFVYRERASRKTKGLIPHARFLDSSGALPCRTHSFAVLPSSPLSPSRTPPIPPPKSPWAISSRPSLTPLPNSPSSKRRSYVIPRPHSEASSILYLNDLLEYAPRPDSATLPDPTFSRLFAEPTPPVSPLSVYSAAGQRVQDVRSPLYKKVH